ncbi:hypothetical protein JCM15548_14418 [Geofilum rubicundum JCM 15548]|uniref:Uncharacterized protein n=1 Tax=Geofilum rubicundum JCM 15548 TaxID=1236989 RepID=A0A0E9LQL1_9BACT|nr:hypothetical protein JCM15548_14418 [Geofilum rubicundum JCM 15548]
MSKLFCITYRHFWTTETLHVSLFEATLSMFIFSLFNEEISHVDDHDYWSKIAIFRI